MFVLIRRKIFLIDISPGLFCPCPPSPRLCEFRFSIYYWWRTPYVLELHVAWRGITVVTVTVGVIFFHFVYFRNPTSRHSRGPASDPLNVWRRKEKLDTPSPARPPRAGTRAWAISLCPRSTPTRRPPAWRPPPAAPAWAAPRRTWPESVPGQVLLSSPAGWHFIFRSSQSLKTPLLDQTNTPAQKKNTSKVGRTPLNVKKFLGSAFKWVACVYWVSWLSYIIIRRGGKSKSYKMMDVQDKTINRDQNNLTTPMKAKEKVNKKSPLKKIKL